MVAVTGVHEVAGYIKWLASGTDIEGFDNVLAKILRLMERLSQLRDCVTGVDSKTTEGTESCKEILKERIHWLTDLVCRACYLLLWRWLQVLMVNCVWMSHFRHMHCIWKA